ncbi:serine/threonine-protein kinase [Stigmatella aurantiaca]|uniref:Serine/threonine kinase PKN11 n=1 Tax=Stigmatella aurantiaca (strain DW4/3-1) TaxID=378806 RepID=Q091Q5_STIAD|nr:serine/threonine-protein kinase [Stigmatella aurantiaca]ADO68645.1 Serine/threonine kinase family protein [Stigmatella aurantiaca DW4/3-1]EAU66460.1 serine/threonine kinase PKN11 [Stigmatella aurantiaca DW4/3-1]
MSSPPTEPHPPQVLLRSGHTSYEFVQWLGPARHGELILVRRRYGAAFGGYAVIKRPSPAGSEEARRRLVEEARVTSQLSHPNILTVHPLKGTDDAPLLLLEHVPKHRLEAVLAASERAQQPLSEAFACHVVAEVAEALHHAHALTDEHGRALGIVHRDVTPHNILISEHGAVKLLEFGVAWSRLAGRLGSEGSEWQGSLAYAAPELAQGLALEARADQFSLGIVLLQLLTGRHLFEGAEAFDARQRQALPPDATQRQCAQELLGRIRNYSGADREAATRAVPEALRATVHRALAPDPGDRFLSCAHLASALREHLRVTGQHFGRQEALAELVTLHYVALRVESGEDPDDALQDRLLPEQTQQGSRPPASQRAARPRSLPRRR